MKPASQRLYKIILNRKQTNQRGQHMSHHSSPYWYFSLSIISHKARQERVIGNIGNPTKVCVVSRKEDLKSNDLLKHKTRHQVSKPFVSYQNTSLLFNFYIIKYLWKR